MTEDDEKVFRTLHLTASTAFDRFVEIMNTDEDIRKYIAAVMAKTITDAAYIDRVNPPEKQELISSICVRAMTAISARFNQIING